MKKLVFIAILAIYSISVNAQLDIKYGIKTGLNYTSYGNLSIYGGFAGLNEIVLSEQDFGFHVGAHAQYNFTKIYIRPELVFTKTKSTYSHIFSTSSEFKVSTLEIPVLVGFKIIKPISFYVGPTFQYILVNKFSSDFDLDLENNLVLGLNMGIGIQLQKLGFDLRYSPGLSENLAVFRDDLPVDGLAYSINTKSDQIIFSFSYQFN